MLALHAEQQYIDTLSRQLGIPYSLKEHDRATSTCHEKAELLGWPAERVVKQGSGEIPGNRDPFINMLKLKLNRS